jgi:hypothetical protein
MESGGVNGVAGHTCVGLLSRIGSGGGNSGGTILRRRGGTDLRGLDCGQEGVCLGSEMI